MNEEKILTLHPKGKTGRNITKSSYDSIKEAILAILHQGEVTHNELFDKLNKNLQGKFQGSINWYGETVKLDLEARKVIQRTDSKPQKYKLT